MKFSIVVCFLFVTSTFGAPNLRVIPDQLPPHLLTLPGNATSIRADINDSFSCEGREYGYYADVENECQLFHVCLPITYANGRTQMFRWSFICPEETIFNQEMFTCTRSDESIDCYESPRFYNLNHALNQDKYQAPHHQQQVDEDSVLINGNNEEVMGHDRPGTAQEIIGYGHHQQHLLHQQTSTEDGTVAVQEVQQELFESMGERESKPMYSRRFSRL